MPADNALPTSPNLGQRGIHTEIHLDTAETNHRFYSYRMNLKSREIISISEMGLPSRHTEPSASLLFPKGDEPSLAVGKAQLCPNHPAMSASYTSCTVLSRPSAFRCRKGKSVPETVQRAFLRNSRKRK